jgi:hypothetical protein
LRFPDTIGELIRQLDERFPEPVPQPGDSSDKIFHAAGQRSVILFLKNWRDGAGQAPPPVRPRGQGRPVR